MRVYTVDNKQKSVFAIFRDMVVESGNTVSSNFGGAFHSNEPFSLVRNGHNNRNGLRVLSVIVSDPKTGRNLKVIVHDVYANDDAMVFANIESPIREIRKNGDLEAFSELFDSLYGMDHL